MNTTHPSRIVFLINDDVQVIRGMYDPDKPNNTSLFKTMMKDLAEEELVLVETDTRHGYTVVEVVETGIEPDLDSHDNINWAIGRLDRSGHDHLKTLENQAIATVKAAEKARRKVELREAMFAHREEEMKALALTNLSGDDVVVDDTNTIEGTAT